MEYSFLDQFWVHVIGAYEPQVFAGHGGTWAWDFWVPCSRSQIESSAVHVDAFPNPAGCCLKRHLILAAQHLRDDIRSLEYAHVSSELGAGRDLPHLTVLSWTAGPLASGDRSKNDSWPWGREWRQTIASFCQSSETIPALSQAWPPAQRPAELWTVSFTVIVCGLRTAPWHCSPWAGCPAH